MSLRGILTTAAIALAVDVVVAKTKAGKKLTH